MTENEKHNKFSDFAEADLPLQDTKKKLSDKKIAMGLTMEAKLVKSTVEPTPLYIDVVRGGRCRVQCRWDIAEVHENVDDDHIFDGWEYMEAVIWWTFPDSFALNDATVEISSRTDLENYLAQNQTEILSYAKATRISDDTFQA